MAHHDLPATAETITWGYLDAKLSAVLKVASGDTVKLTALVAGGLEFYPETPGLVPESQRATVKALKHELGAHLLTGPVHVESAVPGDVLQIDILDLKLTDPWGWGGVLPLLGTLPDEYPEAPEIIHARLDHERGVAVLPWGTELPLAPFFGILAVAPPAGWGRVTSNIPRSFGGNMDNKELKVGTTLYLPVHADGALFSAGDGHAVQGDGEVCITAIETGLSGTFRLTVRKDLGYKTPFAETETHLISIGIDEDLDDAAKQAVREMVKHVQARTKLTRNQAYMLCSFIGDLRVTQTVDGNKGCHMMLAKKYL